MSKNKSLEYKQLSALKAIYVEFPGVFSEKACYVSTYDGWMYGPYETLEKIVDRIMNNFENEEDLVG